MARKTNSAYKTDGSDRLLPRLCVAVFKRPRTTALIWLLLTVFGVASYTSFLQREGFPNVNIPFSVITGAYLVDNPSKVDAQVTKPISDLVLKDSHVKTVQSHAQANFYDVVVQFKDGTDANQVSAKFKNEIKTLGLPPQATYKVEVPKVGFTQRGDDAVISVYARKPGESVNTLVSNAQNVVDYLKAQHFANVTDISVIDPFVKGTDPLTGQASFRQTNFDRFGQRSDGRNKFYDSVSIGIKQQKGTDVIKLNDKIQKALDSYAASHQNATYGTYISGTYATGIKQQISELQRALFEGLVAVVMVGSIVIAVRAALITIVSMATVLSITLGVLFVIGYTLNTITLFSLVLCLGLIVDDTIIMTEAIDAQRRRQKTAQAAVKEATRKISRAMVAATSTAALSFAPLLFVGGILGGFIRAIPVTIITSLIVSLCVALFFIPLFARYLLLNKMGEASIREPAANFEARVARFIARPMLWAQHSRKKLFGVGIIAIIIGFLFILAGGALFQKVTFNIFPPSKDSDGLIVQLDYNPGTSIERAQALADKADNIVGQNLGSNFQYAAYYTNANTSQAMLNVYLISYNKRAVTAPQMVKQLTNKFKNFDGAIVKISQQDVGPPLGAFTVQIRTDNRAAANKLAQDISHFLQTTQLTRPNGTIAKVNDTSISDPNTYFRQNGQLYVQVSADFKDSDTTTLVTLAQNAIKKEYTPQKLASFGLPNDVIGYDLGEEQDNQNSFKTLAMAFPILLLAIFILLAIQFRSFLQPVLIFMAIPFSLFGITLGLWLTDNAFSFFAMLGFFALIGLSIKNTILLTDYANQLRRLGEPAVPAAVGALEERFRPLIATSLTAVVSLIPLSLSSPFWQGLTVVLIFGLLSSTFLVVTVFPYYYLGAEFLRQHVHFRRRKR